MKAEGAVLKRLGPVPGWRGERKCIDALSLIVRRAREAAERRLALADRAGGDDSRPVAAGSRRATIA